MRRLHDVVEQLQPCSWGAREGCRWLTAARALLAVCSLQAAVAAVCVACRQILEGSSSSYRVTHRAAGRDLLIQSGAWSLVGVSSVRMPMSTLNWLLNLALNEFLPAIAAPGSQTLNFCEFGAPYSSIAHLSVLKKNEILTRDNLI